MARAKTQKKNDPLDGAQYWIVGAKIADYLSDETTGRRPGETYPPKGTMRSYLTFSTKNTPLPPRSIWIKGEWKTMDQSKVGHDDYYTWIVSGEGTSGNYETREYVLPEEIASDPLPQHPADWNASVFKRNKTTTTHKSSAPSLPYGIRFRDPNCGHWFKEDDLAGHAKVCPGLQGESDWAIACHCCDSLDETAKCKPGFPRPKPKVEPKAKAEVKDGDGTPAA